jgi:hypothetical protein
MRKGCDAMRIFTSPSVQSSGETGLPFFWTHSQGSAIDFRINSVNMQDTEQK